MPIGKSRCGFFASSAVVDTASKPMYAKKTTAAAAITPEKPYGMNGDQFVGLDERDAGGDEEQHGRQLDGDHHRIEARAFADADHQQRR